MGDKELIEAGRSGRAEHELVARWRLVGEGYFRTHRRLIAEVERHGINAQWFEVLVRLSESPDQRLPMSKLAGEVSMTSGGLTKLVDRLERVGLTERQSEPTDRRVVHAALTDAGAKAARAAIETYEHGLAAALADVVSGAELAQAATVMSRLVDALAASEEPADVPVEDPILTTPNGTVPAGT